MRLVHLFLTHLAIRVVERRFLICLLQIELLDHQLPGVQLALQWCWGGQAVWILFEHAWIQRLVATHSALSDSWVERARADLADLAYELRRNWLRLNLRKCFALFDALQLQHWKVHAINVASVENLGTHSLPGSITFVLRLRRTEKNLFILIEQWILAICACLYIPFSRVKHVLRCFANFMKTWPRGYVVLIIFLYITHKLKGLWAIRLHLVVFVNLVT